MERVLEHPISTADLANAGEKRNIPVTEPARPTPPMPAKNQTDDGGGPLLATNKVQEFQSRWDRIQTEFVDEPRDAVHKADELVAQAIKNLAESFAAARNGLEEQWSRGDNVSTEDLRVALKKYRSFFHKLLAV
jgi:hypothetical protein